MSIVTLPRFIAITLMEVSATLPDPQFNVPQSLMTTLIGFPEQLSQMST